jgi:hypothetical protein
MTRRSEPIDRRAMLRTTAALALACLLAGVVAGCGGTTVEPFKDRTDYQILLGASPPGSDLVRLTKARAMAVGVAPTLGFAGSGGSYAEELAQTTARSVNFNSQTNSYPPVSNLVVAYTSMPAKLEPIAAQGIKNGVKIVTYPTALKHRTAAIIVDPVAAMTALATQSAAWAKTTTHGHGGVLLVMPGDDANQDPYDASAASMREAARATLARVAPGLRIAATVHAGPYSALGRELVARALRSHPDARVVLSWNDDVARGLAQTLRAHLSPAERKQLFVGALALPSINTPATFAELRRGDVLRVVVTARMRDLANALVDLPARMLTDTGNQGDVKLPLHVLTATSTELGVFSREYSLHPTYPQRGLALNPDAQELAHPAPSRHGPAKGRPQT